MKRETVKKVTAYRTTDGATFSGHSAKVDAEKHQIILNRRAKAREFHIFLKKIFKIGPSEAAEDIFCEEIMKKVAIQADDQDFESEISEFLLDLFNFIGSDRWQKIREFLTEESYPKEKLKMKHSVKLGLF